MNRTLACITCCIGLLLLPVTGARASNCCMLWNGETPGGPTGACEDGEGVTPEWCAAQGPPDGPWEHSGFHPTGHCGPDNLCVNPGPTVSEWSLIVLMVLFLAAGAVIFGRHRRAAAIVECPC